MKHFSMASKSRSTPISVQLVVCEAGRVVKVIANDNIIATLELDDMERVFLRRFRSDVGLPPSEFRCASDGGIYTSSDRRKY